MAILWQAAPLIILHNALNNFYSHPQPYYGKKPGTALQRSDIKKKVTIGITNLLVKLNDIVSGLVGSSYDYNIFTH